MNRHIKGYVTVFLSLILSLMIVFVETVINITRSQTIRMETECVMDAGMNSIFAEYHRELVKQYGLLFIDSSYGSNGNIEKTKSHLLYYLNKNFHANDSFVDLTALQADNCSLSNVSLASDNTGEVLRYQIIRYMETSNGIALLDREPFNPLDDIDYESEYEKYANEREELDGQIDELVEEYNASLQEGEEPVSVSNPAKGVENLSKSSALYYACKDLNSISTNCANLDGLISHRGIKNQGVGLYDNQESPYGPIDEMTYMTYLFNRLGYKDHKKENACLNYQIEYLISGEDADVDNLEDIAEKIFKTRYVVNVLHVYSSATKQAEALSMAVAATILIPIPGISEIVKHAILLAWAYAESAKDMRILFDGHKLPLIKTEADWNTPLTQLLTFKSHLDDYHVPSGSMGYRDYLYSFLLLQSNEKQNMRLMDVMEMDIRLTPGNQRFCMDDQVYQLSAEVNVSSKYGQGYKIKRSFSYK